MSDNAIAAVAIADIFCRLSGIVIAIATKRRLGWKSVVGWVFLVCSLGSVWSAVWGAISTACRFIVGHTPVFVFRLVGLAMVQWSYGWVISVIMNFGRGHWLVGGEYHIGTGFGVLLYFLAAATFEFTILLGLAEQVHDRLKWEHRIFRSGTASRMLGLFYALLVKAATCAPLWILNWPFSLYPTSTVSSAERMPVFCLVVYLIGCVVLVIRYVRDSFNMRGADRFPNIERALQVYFFWL